MKIAFGCDHAGCDCRETILRFLRESGYQVTDLGCKTPERCDYPDFAAVVAEAVSSGKADRGILICGTGIGMSIAANKVPGIRAAVCWTDDIAALIAEHNDANIICLGARFATPEQMIRWIGIWLKTPACRDPRHLKRLEKIAELERK